MSVSGSCKDPYLAYPIGLYPQQRYKPEVWTTAIYPHIIAVKPASATLPPTAVPSKNDDLSEIVKINEEELDDAQVESYQK